MIIDSKNNEAEKKVTAESQLFFLAGIFFLILFYALYFAREIAVPFVFALLLNFLLEPAVKFLEKIYIPVQIGAALVIFLFFLMIGYGSYSLTQPAANWINKGPETIEKADQKLTQLIQFAAKPINAISSISNEVASLGERTQLGKSKNTIPVKENQFVSTLFKLTGQFLGEVGVTIVLLYFFLISDDFLLRKIVNWTSTLEKKKEVIVIARTVQDHVWNYLFARTAINLGVGIIVSISMYLLGMPNSILWGALTGILLFIPYIGALASIIIIALVALFSFDSVAYAFFVTFIFLAIVSLEGSIITPFVIGRAVTLNPIIVFLSLMFWGWLWGIAGAFIAIPLMATIKIISETLYESSLIKELLSD